MKQLILKKLMLIAVLLTCNVTLAHDFEVDGIYYTIQSDSKKTVTVIYRGNSYSEYSHEYQGTVIIPNTVNHNGLTYTVVSIGNDAFHGCDGLTSVSIGNSVTSIGYFAFSGCSGLTSISIGNGVTSIGNDAFSFCTGISSILSANPVPPTCDNQVFYNVNKETITLTVPQESVSLYKSADTWKDFINITGKDMSGVKETLVDESEMPVEYYNLQGVKVENPENGIFIKKQGRKAEKVVM